MKHFEEAITIVVKGSVQQEETKIIDWTQTMTDVKPVTPLFDFTKVPQ